MSIKIHYFAGYGRAEAIRMLLAHAKVPYEDVHYTFAQVPEVKASGILEFGQLPAVEREGKFYCQSVACLRGLGIMLENGYYPTDAYQAYLVDSIVDAVGDIYFSYFTAAFNPNEDAKKAQLEAFLATTLPKFLAAFEKRLEGNSSPDKIVGDKHTIADFALAGLAYSSFLNEANPMKAQTLEVASKFPKLLDYFNGLGETLKEHLATRKPSPW
ncbi:UNKNOWN [Stylonychia lemnae]|uniref:Glutathione s-transferase n=1 Tax=Stylonychia lemnae TaxID=5949 RepID=A0A078AD67_STYLE|nr:UNKNOWN [Stylonychia lemnae]|eukprot:CDW80180.1 UNKNOWN [Stylonychia lemnae]